jgi:hypothetical protein
MQRRGLLAALFGGSLIGATQREGDAAPAVNDTGDPKDYILVVLYAGRLSTNAEKRITEQLQQHVRLSRYIGPILLQEAAIFDNMEPVPDAGHILYYAGILSPGARERLSAAWYQANGDTPLLILEEGMEIRRLHR